MPEDFQKSLRRGAVGIDAVDDFPAIKVQHRLGLAFVGFEPRADDFDVRIVQPVVLERAALHPRNEVFKIGAAHVKDGGDVDKFAEHFCLMDVARDAVEHQRIAARMKPPGRRQAVRELLPQLDGWFIGHELAATGVFDKNSSQRGIGTQVTEHIAATAMNEAGNRAENFSMRAFARAGRAEHENRAVFQAAFG